MTDNRYRGMAHAVIRSDPPEVIVAEDIDVLHRVLGLHVIARLPASAYPPGVAARVREALLAGRWATALAEWMDATDTVVDVYDDLTVWTADRLAEEDLAGVELQFSPLFQETD